MLDADGESSAMASRRRWWPAIIRAAGASALFFVVYGGCNAIAAHREMAGAHIRTLWFAWERHIPLVPAFVVPYMSADLFFVIAFFLCSNPRELQAHTKRICAATLLAGVCFLAMPLKIGFARPPVGGAVAGPLFRLLWAFDQPYNLVPSLHIAYLLIQWPVFMRHTRGLMRGAVFVWLLLIGISPALTHQHHVADLATGALLAWICRLIVRDRHELSPPTPIALEEAA